jgi:predicted nucleotidyltransferase
MVEIIKSSQVKIINEVITNPGINLRGIIEKTRLSPNFVSKYLNLLVEKGIVREIREEKKRVYLRKFYYNFSLGVAKSLYVLVKDEDKEKFFKEYGKLKPIFTQIISQVKGIESLVVYGSYARLSATGESDLDILIVGSIRNKERIREILVTFEKEVSIKIESVQDFKKRRDDAIHMQIIKEGIIIIGAENFVELIKKERGDYLL